MIVGVDPQTTLLSLQERDKVIVRTLLKLCLGRFRYVKKWDDGILEVVFQTSDDYEHYYIIREGLVEFSSTPREGKDYSIIGSCLATRDLGIGSLCYEECGCSCIIAEGYESNTGRDESLKYSAHCRGVDLSRTLLGSWNYNRDE